MISMTLAYVPEHWPLASFQESSHVINAVRAEGDLAGMISLTQLHKKAPYLPDISYREYSQHMTIAPLNLPDPSAPPDDAGFLMCGPPHDFAVGALHCKHSSSGKTGKMAFLCTSGFPEGSERGVTGMEWLQREDLGRHRLWHGPSRSTDDPFELLHEVECQQQNSHTTGIRLRVV